MKAFMLLAALVACLFCSPAVAQYPAPPAVGACQAVQALPGACVKVQSAPLPPACVGVQSVPSVALPQVSYSTAPVYGEFTTTVTTQACGMAGAMMSMDGQAMMLTARPVILHPFAACRVQCLHCRADRIEKRIK